MGTANFAATWTAMGGTSIAAPHATGTVALLQQYVAGSTLGADAKRHEVMKAILMNSAEKVKDRIGMTRTVQKTNGKDWDNSDARDADDNQGGRTLPLDEQMGFGF